MSPSPSPPASRSPSRLDTMTGMLSKRMLSLLLGNPVRAHVAPNTARNGVGPYAYLEVLPDELWLNIFEYLAWPGELRGLLSVSRAMYGKVLPVLYRTVIVAWGTPGEMHATLSLLARDDRLAACVRCLVFDDDPGKYGRSVADAEGVRSSFQREETLLRTGKKVDDKDLELARSMLYHVLPTFTNLREVVLARAHPLFFTASAWLKQAPPQERSPFTKLLRPMRERRQRTPLPDEVFHRSSGNDLWATMARRRTGKTTTGRITRLVAPLSIPRAPQSKFTMSTITSLTLHHPRLAPDDRTCVKRWNKAIRAAKALQRLCLIDISSSLTMLTGCTFPHLEHFEASGLPSRSTDRNALLSRFLLAHSATLIVIAIQLNPARSASPFFLGEWMREPTKFVRLRTLRIEAIPRAHPTGWYAQGCPAEGPEHVAAWEPLFNFARTNPTLDDLAFSGAPLAGAQALRIELLSRPIPMSRLMLGIKLLQSFESTVGPNCVYGIPWKRHIYRFRFAVQHWAFFTVLFDGLELARSGYQPSPRRD